jgi:CheY-like chemotaxis protein
VSACYGKAFQPDLILTDLMMPDMDGIELTRRIRAMTTLVDVPVVALTAYASPEAERLAGDAGVVDFIRKPVEVPTLLERLSALGSPTGPICV